MARLVFPDSVAGWIKLFRKVKPAVLALAPPNTIQSYMTENGVSLAADETLVIAADAAATLAEQKEASAEKHTKAGQLLLERCDKDHRKCVQSLKTIHRTNPRKLGDWGATVDNESKVVYKSDADGHATEMQALITKHGTFPVGTSPLEPVLVEEGIDLTLNATDITNAIIEFDKAEADHELSETKNAEVTLKLTNVIEHLRGIGQAAVRMYASNPHKASDLGFNIDSSTQAAKLRTYTLEPGEVREFKKLNMGSFITVTSEGEIAITPVSKLTARRGTRAIANKNKNFLLTFGFGSSLIQNLSDTEQVTFTVEVNH